jgi:hypothetical protein
MVSIRGGGGTVAEFNDDNPTTYKEDANQKGKADDCYAEFKRKENLSKGATLLLA